MSKRKHKDDSCCVSMCCMNNNCGCCSGGYGRNDGFGFGNGILEAILFWLIACGAGLLNNSSILIILLFLLYGWSCNSGCGGNGFGM